MGNSEVGHMNLGAGRIVYQDLAKINLAVENKTFNKEKVIADAFAYAKEFDKPVHRSEGSVARGAEPRIHCRAP